MISAIGDFVWAGLFNSNQNANPPESEYLWLDDTGYSILAQDLGPTIEHANLFSSKFCFSLNHQSTGLPKFRHVTCKHPNVLFGNACQFNCANRGKYMYVIRPRYMIDVC